MNAVKRKTRRPGMMTLLIICGLMLINISVFFSGNISRITVHHWIYRMDFRHWPPGFGVALWLILICLAMNTFLFRPVAARSEKGEWDRSVEKNRARRICRLVNIASVLGAVYLVAFTFLPKVDFWRRIYYLIIVPFYLEPMALFFYDGTLTKRLLVQPLTAFVVIGILLYANHVIKKRMKCGKTGPIQPPRKNEGEI